MRRCLTVFLILALGLAAGAQQSRSVADILKQFPKPQSILPDGPLQTARIHLQEGSSQIDLIDLSDPIDGTAAHIEVHKQPPAPWNIQLAWTCRSAVHRDDTMLLVFRARNLNPEDWGRAEATLVFRRSTQPFNNAIGDVCPIWGGWREYAVPFSPDVDLDEGKSYMIMNFGSKRQKLEVAHIRLYNFKDQVGMGRLCKALGDKARVVGRKKIGHPLSPTSLWNLGALPDLPDPDPQFRPDGSWTNTYVIWTNRGWIGRTAWDVGYLRLHRIAGDPFALDIDQRIVNLGGVLHRLQASILCHSDPIATPINWTIDSRIISPEGQQRELAHTIESATVDNGIVRIQHGDSESTRAVPSPFTSDWSLFEAVQRLPFHEGPPLQFHLLDRLNALKRDHHLVYRGKNEFHFGDDSLMLHHFQQVGHGILPYDYWLDESHRLIFAITHSRAYILTDRAENRMKAFLDDQIRWYTNRKNQREGAQDR